MSKAEELATKMSRMVAITTIQRDTFDDVAAELRRLEAENVALKVANEHLNNIAQTAEKWQGIAIARGGDGRTVNQLVGPLNERINALEREKAELLEALKGLANVHQQGRVTPTEGSHGYVEMHVQNAEAVIAEHGGTT